MLQLRRRLDLAQEPITAERRRELRVEHFDRDVSIVLEVVREIHGGHAAGAELARDAVAIRESEAELLDGVRHESGLMFHEAERLRLPGHIHHRRTIVALHGRNALQVAVDRAQVVIGHA